MNRKTLIIILSVVGVICLCAVIVGVVLLTQGARLIGQTVSTDSDKTASVAEQITDYQLPTGYKESFSMSLFGVSMAGISSSDDSTMIMLFQFPKDSGMSQEQMEAQMQQMSSQQMGGDYNLEKVGTQKATIRGQAVELGVYEGTNQDGGKVRQLLGVFEGKSGTAFLMVIGPAAGWDQKGIDAFIASMR